MKKVIAQKEEGKYLLYYIGYQQFGIKIDQVQEVLALQTAAQLPKLPHFVEGVINYQDKVIPLVDLRKRFGLQKVANKELTRIMVIRINDELVAMIADDIHSIIKIEQKLLKKPSKMFRGLDEDYIAGVAPLNEGSIIVLDLQKILSDEEKIELFGLESSRKSISPRIKAKSRKKRR